MISFFSENPRRPVVALAYPPGGTVSFSQIPTAPFVVPMYPYHPRLLAKPNIEKQYISHRVNDVCNGSPSRIRRVLRISFGMTILPRSSTRRTMPVAFIFFSPLKRKALFTPVEVFAGKGELCMMGVQMAVGGRPRRLREKYFMGIVLAIHRIVTHTIVLPKTCFWWTLTGDYYKIIVFICSTARI